MERGKEKEGKIREKCCYPEQKGGLKLRTQFGFSFLRYKMAMQEPSYSHIMKMKGEECMTAPPCVWR